MKAKSIFEKIHFDRSQDPKSSMGIGLRAKACPIIAIKRFDGRDYLGTEVSEFMKKYEEEIRDARKFIEVKINEDELFRNKKRTNWGYADLNQIRNMGWTGIKWAHLFIPFDNPNLKEGLDFERGKNPKESMNLGMLEEIKKKMAKIGWKYDGPNSILKWAATEEHPEYIEYAVKNGAWVDKHPGAFALQALTRWKKPDPQILEYLIKNGADPSVISYFDIKNFILDKHPEFMDMIRKYYPEIDEIISHAA